LTNARLRVACRSRFAGGRDNLPHHEYTNEIFYEILYWKTPDRLGTQHQIFMRTVWPGINGVATINDTPICEDYFMSRRPRGRGRKPQHNNNHNKNPNRSLDSNGPDIRVRGSAKTIFDKYTALAHDASVSGHRVKAESYLQHAEHYFRILQEIQEKAAAKAELHQKEQAKIQAKKQEQAQKQQQASGNDQDTHESKPDKSASRSRSYLNRRQQSNGEANEGEAAKEDTVQADKKTPKKSKKPEPATSEDEPAAAE